MKFPSVKKITESVAAVIKRFPFEMLFALTGTIAAIAWVELQFIRPLAESWCIRVIMMANLGLLLSLATTLYTASKGISVRKAFLFKLAAAVFGVILIFIINPYEREADRIRFLLLSLSFHLLVAFASFTVKGHVQGFWQFNKELFLRILTSALYSAVLFAGISAALGAMNFLFNFKFEFDTFFILWACIVGLFNTVFFLAGVPDDFKSLDTDDSYPKGLKVFTQYVLIPLATLYVVILLAYETKILIQWNLPKGLVSNLILGYAVFGILSILLVYPVREQAENKWIKTYARSFYFLMLPLLILLFLAVGTRVFRYGITEDRYFLLVLAIWLLFITVYFLISKKQNIKLIPISLCIFTLLSIYGPQSAFSVSKYSQQRILINIFKKNNDFKNGLLIPVDSVKMKRKDGNRAVATLDYLVRHHDITSVTGYLPADFDKKLKPLSKPGDSLYLRTMYSRYDYRYDKLESVKRYLHLTRFNAFGSDDDVEIPINPDYVFTSPDKELLEVKGYDYVLMGREFESDTLETQIGTIKIIKHGRSNNIQTLNFNNEEMVFDIKAKMNHLLQDKSGLEKLKDTANHNEYAKQYLIKPQQLNITQKSLHFEVMLNIKSVTVEVDKNKNAANVTFLNGQYLIKVKR